METVKKIAGTIALSASLLSGAAAADTFTPVYTFGGVSINNLNWSDGTEDRSASGAQKRDFNYISFDGGMGFTWGEFYGFFDLENPGQDRDEKDGGDAFRTAHKVTFHYYLGDTNFTLYSHIYNADSKGFTETNYLGGMGYRFATESGLWVKPFIAANYTDSSAAFPSSYPGGKSASFSGYNGMVAGWTAGYAFEVMGQPLMVTNWNEIEFDRAAEYKASNGDRGVNGAVALWWTPVEKITAGIQYRYAEEKLGVDGYQNAMIYTLKYNF
ncbi:outer membrane protein OmpK [Parendozoicomonas haliclonae]|uniref:Nucleoside-specific channel-forming protein, Tsx n=1 Tax=Parendozoicomonas haliclonae TaxID=1960125 RepID=A0A1X7AJV9_9GAMM|nr:outer membrane protein OmpK [Parendozoicomonas haliclonae]SMA46378.1 hypothetical protein EHSB41UT_02156 [Parendozoicomonas haliclonae]